MPRTLIIPDIHHQIVGHTPDLEVRYKSTAGGTAACLDIRLCYVGVLEDGVFHARTTPVWEKWFGPQGQFSRRHSG